MNNNTCQSEVELETILIDTDVIRNNSVADLQTETNVNDLILGADKLVGHARTFPDVGNPLTEDINEPYLIPDRGILFKGMRYLAEDNTLGLVSYWMLDHPHFFTMQAWVRKDIDDEFDNKMDYIPGYVFRKTNTVTGVINFGM